jgi:hypothetical protein
VRELGKQHLELGIGDFHDSVDGGGAVFGRHAEDIGDERLEEFDFFGEPVDLTFLGGRVLVLPHRRSPAARSSSRGIRNASRG